MPVHNRLSVAHRGFSYIAPENTLLAYKMAVQFKANGAECDVHTTSDGVIVLSHDGNMKRTLGKDALITNTPFSEFRKADAGLWMGKQFKGEVPPTLEEFLELLNGTTCYPVIEIKMKGIEQPVIDLVKKHGLLDVSTIITFDAEVAAKVRKMEPDISVAWLYSEDMKGKTAEAEADRLTEFFLQKCAELDTNILDLNYGLLSEKLIKNLHDHGVVVWAWTVDNPKGMEQLLDWGIDSITTNRTDLLAEVLKKRKM
ncbi:MAG: hypothetical protein LBQ54_13935 [Planctomycetaceae bacterium]|nr:hypothetical protein [Planctomycetaceae bacterium]